VTKLSNADPNSTVIAPNPNKFVATDNVLPLRFRVAWTDEQGPISVETVYVITSRGY
jgi:hypothetical protein